MFLWDKSEICRRHANREIRRSGVGMLELALGVANPEALFKIL